MSSPLKFVLGVTFILIAVAVDVQADVVTPTSAIASSAFAIPPAAMIDGSGLNGVGNVPDQLHDTDENGMWIAGLGSQAQDEFVEFTLDRNYDLSAAYIWNYNGVDGFGTDNSARGVDEFELLVSPDLESPYVSVGTFNLTQADPLFTTGEPSQTKMLTGANDVRRVMFDINSAHGGATFEFVGLSEVRFEGTPLALGPDRTWVADSFGEWLDDTKWDPAFAPNGTDQTATFGPVITAPRTVVADQEITIKAITFNNTNSYVIAGAGSVSLDPDMGNASITVIGNATAGSHQFQAIVNLANDTDVDVGSGAQLSFNNALNLGGNTLTKTGAGMMAVNNQLNTGGGSINAAAGIIAGSGTVGGDLNNTGATVAPGNTGGGSVSALSVAGNYAQSAGSTLAIEINGIEPGNGHDQLVVNQAASLEGALEIDTLVDYDDPQVRGDHDDLVLLIAESIGGTFASVDYDGTALSTGANYVGTNDSGEDGMFRNLSYSGTDVMLTNYLALGGDANGDLIVDGLDFIIWNGNKFTSGHDWSGGDFNGDGIVDGLDFIIWNSNKFTSADGAVAVPEPTLSLLMLTGLIGCGLIRRRSGSAG